jgi:hypothetical protein
MTDAIIAHEFSKTEFMLLYSSMDGKCSLSDFHKAIEGKYTLVTLFETEDNQILASFLSGF